MNPSILDDFVGEINQIRAYIKHIQQVNKIASYEVNVSDREEITLVINELQAHYKIFARDKKVFEYKSIIISLYGILEKNIEIWIKEFLDLLCDLTTYDLIDNKIKEEHFKLSMNLISILIEDRWDKYRHLTKEIVLKNLNNCICGLEKFRFNTDAFIIKSGNLKHKKIAEIFNTIGINLNEFLIRNESLNNEIGIPANKVSTTEKEVLYFKINDLVDRRNRIAHGSETIDDLLDLTLLEAYIDFLEKYCTAIFESLGQEHLRLMAKYRFNKIEVVHHIWQNSIVGFELENYTIKKGDLVIIETASKFFSKVSVLELRKKDKSYSQLSINEKDNICMKIGESVNMNCIFYLEIKL